MSAHDDALALDLGQVESDLRIEGHRPFATPDWLAASYERPAAFWAALMQWVRRTSPIEPRSEALQRYDFFHDFVSRHLGGDAPAMTWPASFGSAGHMSYGDLARRSARRAHAWRSADVQPGQVLAIVRPPGPELLVSVVAALRSGLVFSIIPPHGRDFTRRRIEALAPAAVDVDARLWEDWKTGEAIVPPATPPVGTPTPDEWRNEVVPSGSVAALLFDPSAPALLAPRPVTADALYLTAARDAIVAAGLRRGARVAAPGMYPLDAWPSLPLTALFAGGTYHHVEAEELEKDPGLLAEGVFDLVGVSSAVRESLLARPRALGDHWRGWFRNPADSLDLDRWQKFIEATGLQGAWTSNLAFAPALGGAVLFSSRRRGTAHADIAPAAGVPYRFDDFIWKGVESMSGHGRLALMPPGAPKAESVATCHVIAPQRGGWVYAGNVAEGTQGRRFLRDEILASIQGIPGCLGAALVLCPIMGPSRHRVDVVLFTGTSGRVRDVDLIEGARRRIATSLGSEHLPERIVAFPLVPRTDEQGAVDQAWCRDQYIAGALSRRSRDQVQRLLTALWEQARDGGSSRHRDEP